MKYTGRVIKHEEIPTEDLTDAEECPICDHTGIAKCLSGRSLTEWVYRECVTCDGTGWLFPAVTYRTIVDTHEDHS